MTACVAFAGWRDATAARELVVRSDGPAAAYQPGRFFARELPYLEAALVRLGEPLAAALVDGYVWLGDGVPGLGAHLHAALGGAVAVVGVAKSRYRGAPAIEVVRGDSRRPLYVTAAGLDAAEAAAHVRAMHGPHRIPALVKRADTLARQP
ncbi:MAG TPA: hypothetical protein VLX92_27540 [Kofleriaceae bacterium]|nr:hypothetical protein [Kofleriaceae bacterium]